MRTKASRERGYARNFIVTTRVDAATLAAALRALESREFTFYSTSDAVSEIIATLAALLHAEPFESTEAALSWLNSRGFSIRQLSSRNNGALRATLAAESISEGALHPILPAGQQPREIPPSKGEFKTESDAERGRAILAHLVDNFTTPDAFNQAAHALSNVDFALLLLARDESTPTVDRLEVLAREWEERTTVTSPIEREAT